MKTALALLFLILPCAAESAPDSLEAHVPTVAAELGSKLPASEKARFERGVLQAARAWRPEDGSLQDFKDFCANRFFHGPELDALFERLERKFEKIDGHFMALGLELTREQDESRLAPHPVDGMLAAFEPAAHLDDDLFKSKLAFVVLLNFPLKTLADCRAEGPGWTRRQWAEARLAQRFRARVPASVQQEAARIEADAHEYVNGYNIVMDRVRGPDGKVLFREGLKLISHWGLRDEIIALYSDAKANLARQDAILGIMERIIRQEIPSAVVDNPKAYWDPASNAVEGAGADREPDTRYAKWLAVAGAMRAMDPYYPDYPTHMDRSFGLWREMPEPEVEALLTGILKDKAGAEAAALVKARLGRALRPFDIWYGGFKPGGDIPEAKLDLIVKKKYPDVESFQRSLPDILLKLGFDRASADFLAARIDVDPARGSGHAKEPGMRTEKSHLRTKVPPGGMDYKGFNIAMHELGHCVEQVLSLYKLDHTLLRGTPNSAFSEGYAFVFQARDLEVLGVEKPDPKADHLKALDLFWSLREIAGVSLVEMRVWRWLYDHPGARPGEFREAVVRIATEVWNEHYAPVFGVEDSPVLAIYSHMIDYALYLPNYPIGYVVAYQIQDYFKTRPLGREMERQCALGALTPEEWMKKAVGSGVSARPILEAASRAAARLRS